MFVVCDIVRHRGRVAEMHVLAKRGTDHAPVQHPERFIPPDDAQESMFDLLKDIRLTVRAVHLDHT